MIDANLILASYNRIKITFNKDNTSLKNKIQISKIRNPVEPKIVHDMLSLKSYAPGVFIMETSHGENKEPYVKSGESKPDWVDV